MSIRRAAVILVLGMVTASCNERSSHNGTPSPNAEERKSEPDGENERQPREDEVAEDCVAFVRATRIVPAQDPKSDCPNCTSIAETAEALAFRQFQTDRISCSGDTCEIDVTIRAAFNQGSLGAITGGLTAWLSAEQRNAYLIGHPPTGQQAFSVKVIYKRASNGWRAVEFDKAETR
jgi:hypothetical protein